MTNNNKAGKEAEHKQIQGEGIGIEQSEILKYLIESGAIDISDIKTQMQRQKIKDCISEHKYSIYQGNDGRWITYLPDDKAKGKRRKIAKKSEDEIYETLYQYYKDDELSSMADTESSLRELYPRWLSYKELHTRASTYITRIDSEWKRYYADTKIVEIPIRKITKLMLDEWAHKLIKENNMTANQYYNCTVIMRQALTYAADLGIIDENPFLKVTVDGKRLFRKQHKKTSNSQVFTNEEVRKIKSLAWNDYNTRKKLNQNAPLAVIFQFLTGVRIGEVCVLKFSDVNGDYIHVQRMIRRDKKEIVEHTKGNSEDRKVILTNEAKKIIECAKKRQEDLGIETEYIFSTGENPISYYAVSDLYRKYCKQMGIEHKSSHKSRKTFISTMIDAQMNINTIRELVGHSDERTTYKNYCFDRCTDTEKKRLMEDALKLDEE